MKKKKLLACLVLAAMIQVLFVPVAEAFLGGLLGGIARGAGGLLGGITRGAGGLLGGLGKGLGGILSGVVKGAGGLLGNIWKGLGWLFGGGPAAAMAEMKAKPGADGLAGAQALFRQNFENPELLFNPGKVEPAKVSSKSDKSVPVSQPVIKKQNAPIIPEQPKNLSDEDSPGN